MRLFRRKAASPAEGLDEPKREGNVNDLIAAHHDPNVAVVSGATEALGELSDARAAGPLVEIVKNGLVELRKGTWRPQMRDAADALGELRGRDRNAVDPLVEPLIDELTAALSERTHLDQDASICRKLVDTLEGLRATAPLIAALQGDNWRARAFAAEALGGIGDPAAIEPLIAALKHDDSDSVRGNAAAGLGHIGDERAVEPLIDALGDPATRFYVGRALEAIGGPEAEAALARGDD